MEITITTPAILFPALSLLMLAYTNRYLTLANRIRALHDQFINKRDCGLRNQIVSLRYRVILIKHMQSVGVLSLFLCTFSMILLFLDCISWGKIVFGASLFCMLISLAMSFWEIQISVKALNMHLSDLSDSDCFECGGEDKICGKS